MFRLFALAVLATLAFFACADAKVSSDKIFKLTHLTRQDVDSLPQWKINSINKLASRLLNFRKLFETAQKNRECLVSRDAKIEAAIEALESARRCRYNGLTFHIFAALRPICNLRRRQANRVSQLKAQCNKMNAGNGRMNCRNNRLAPASNYLTEIQAVCIRAGLLNGPRTGCAAIQPLRVALNQARAVDCGTGIYTYQEIVDIINSIIDRIRELLDGTPLPSNDPNFIDISLTPVQ